ncbi:hypothetical protein ACOMHN_057370 [Nucella lapillus]
MCPEHNSLMFGQERIIINKYLKPVDFFKLFLTIDLVQHLCSRFHPSILSVHVRQPKLVNSYNQHMAGEWTEVTSLLDVMRTLRKVNRWLKTLFYPFLDVARVNSDLLFKGLDGERKKKQPDIPELQRPKVFNQLDFTVELIKQLANITEDSEVASLTACSSTAINIFV